MTFRKLQWDSDFFGMPIGEIEDVGETGPLSGLEGIDLLYVKSERDGIPGIEGFEHSFSEEKVIFTKKVEQPRLPAGILSDTENPVAASELYELAYESGKFSRFLLDPVFGEEKFRKLYRAWIDNSLDRKFSDIVFYSRDEQGITGFVTVKAHGNHALVGLIAVSPKLQGKGIGRKLLERAESWTKGQGLDGLDIPTQSSNLTACGFYSKMGYSVCERMFIHHLKRTSSQTRYN